MTLLGFMAFASLMLSGGIYLSRSVEDRSLAQKTAGSCGFMLGLLWSGFALNTLPQGVIERIPYFLNTAMFVALPIFGAFAALSITGLWSRYR